MNADLIWSISRDGNYRILHITSPGQPMFRAAVTPHPYKQGYTWIASVMGKSDSSKRMKPFTSTEEAMNDCEIWLRAASRPYILNFERRIGS